MSRLTYHFCRSSPIARRWLRAEFVSFKGLNTLYRGYYAASRLTADDDLTMAVINWKKAPDEATKSRSGEKIDGAIATPPPPRPPSLGRRPDVHAG